MRAFCSPRRSLSSAQLVTSENNRFVKVGPCYKTHVGFATNYSELSSCRVRCRGTADDDVPDIDALAKRLSQEASRLRSESDVSSDDESPPDLSEVAAQANASAASQSPFGVGDGSAREDAQCAAGPPNFQPADFVIFQQLGSLEVQQVVAGDLSGSWSDSVADAGAAVESVPAVNAFAATYESGMPFQGPVTVLLKEFLPGSRMAGVNELRLLGAIQPLPEDADRWRAASADMIDSPVVPALGWFAAPPTVELPRFRSPDADSLWVVYKWEALRPVQAYPTFRQPTSGTGLQFFQRADQTPHARRCRMLRAILKGSLQAVAAAHARGVIHGSLGTGSIMVSTLEDARADYVAVKLDNFGFGQLVTGATDADSPAVYARQADCEALAIAFCELVFGSLSMEGASGSTSSTTFQRLLTDVFAKDVIRFKEYCLDVDEWSEAVNFLDEVDGSGWDLLDGLLSGEQACCDLLESPFFNAE